MARQLDGPYAPTPSTAESIRPAHILITYLAYLDTPQTETALRSSLHAIARTLSDIANLTDQEMDEELRLWISKNLLKRDSRDQKWAVPRHLRELYSQMSSDLSKEIDTSRAGRLEKAINDARLIS